MVSWTFFELELLDCFNDLLAGVIMLVDGFIDSFNWWMFSSKPLRSYAGSVLIIRFITLFWVASFSFCNL